MGEFAQISEHESTKGDWVSKDYVVSEGDSLPWEAENEAYLYKVILRGHDVYEDEEGKITQGEQKYLSTNLYENIDEAEGDAEMLKRSYKGRWEQEDVIIRAYFHT